MGKIWGQAYSASSRLNTVITGDKIMNDSIDFATKVRLTRVLLNRPQFAFARAMGVAPITMSRWETATQVPHRTTQRMFVIFAERNGVVFDDRGYPSMKAGSPASMLIHAPHESDF